MKSGLLKFNVLEVLFEHVVKFSILACNAILQAIKDLLKYDDD